MRPKALPLAPDTPKSITKAGYRLNAIAAHHEISADGSGRAGRMTISGARPGARKELLENYVKRLEELEGIATSFEGVSKAYAIQAGREIRIMVNPDNVDDDATYLLCKDIAEKIEKNLIYTRARSVTVIRERRARGCWQSRANRHIQGGHFGGRLFCCTDKSLLGVCLMLEGSSLSGMAASVLCCWKDAGVLCFLHTAGLFPGSIRKPSLPE